mmetsp:Transcript_10701/g.18748  ORF Transcript_10701/g.18748 Transcript_10701/m.18748 type:complete len:349 (-) Transcript_10701:18-1064(-)
MRAQKKGLLALRVELLLHELGPHLACSAQLGNLHVEVHADGEEEGQTRSNLVHVQTCRLGRSHVLNAVRNGEGQLQLGVRAGLLDVVATDGDAVELGHVVTGVGEDALDDTHRRRGRVDVGVAHHVLLQNVVLDGAGELGLVHARLLRGDDEEGKHRQHSAVHGHGHGHLVQRDVLEQSLHVLHGGDRHTSHAYITNDTGVVRVVATVSGQIERHGQTLLTSFQVLLVEAVGLFGSTESSVLSDGPRLGGVHGCVRTSGVRIDSGKFALAVSVNRLELNALRGHLLKILRKLHTAELFGHQLGPSRVVLRSTESSSLLVLVVPSFKQIHSSSALGSQLGARTVHCRRN